LPTPLPECRQELYSKLFCTNPSPSGKELFSPLAGYALD
jgi:hypothetical protein